MISRRKKFWSILTEAWDEFGEDHASKLSASLAYYTIFSIGPLLLLIINMLGFIYKNVNVTDEVLAQVSDVIGKPATMQLQSILGNLSLHRNSTLFTVVGILVFVFGATSIFTEIQSSINYIWSIKAKPKRGWLMFIKNRLVAFVLILGMGFLMMMTLFINLVVDMISGRLQPILGDANVFLLKAANIATLYLIVTVVFAIIFKVLPDAKIHWKDALIGASFTGLLFLVGKFGIGYYLGAAKQFNAYGAATSLILVLTWVYYSAMILYYGAEFTEVYAKRWGRSITVNKNSVHILKHETSELPEMRHPDSKQHPDNIKKKT